MSIVAGLVLFCCLFNALFLEKYYIRQQQKALVQSFDRIKEVINGSDIDQNELGKVMYDISTERNMTALVVDSNFEKVYSLKADIDKTKKWLQDFYFLQSPSSSNVIARSDSYVIQTSYNIYDQQSYLELIGNDDNYMYNILIQVPLESISKNVGISNRFFIIVGAVGMLVGGIIAFFVAGQFTRPIKRLSLTAEAMAKMDFDVKYESKDKGEIGMLGESINKMSDNLRHYISDLKSANLELQKDIDKKEEIDNMRKDFISNVSHELKTPIALIQGYAEGLKDGITDDPESTGFYCDVIIDEAAKMNNMVKKLLTLNQIEFGNEELVMERFDIIELITSIVNANELRASQKGIQIEFNQRDEHIDVWSDEYKIEEVVTNYITNAINHCDFENRIEVSVERIGDDSAEADAELLAMTVECLLKAGLKEFQVSVGQVDYFKSLLQDANLDIEEEENLRSLISQKNYFGVEDLVRSQNIPESLEKAFLELPHLFGSSEVLQKARSLTDNICAIKAVERLEEIYEILKIYGYEKYVSFDFGMLSKFQYYTGIIFQAYTYGTGEPVVKGGRYNNLLKHFGKPAASIGFGITVDNLLMALSRQKISLPEKKSPVILTYTEANRREAILEAQKLRNEGTAVALRREKEDC